MRCEACYTPNVKISIQEKKVPHSYMLIPNKSNDTDRESLEKFYTRVKNRLHKVMQTGEQRQEAGTLLLCSPSQINCSFLSCLYFKLDSLIEHATFIDFSLLSQPYEKFLGDVQSFNFPVTLILRKNSCNRIRLIGLLR